MKDVPPHGSDKQQPLLWLAGAFEIPAFVGRGARSESHRAANGDPAQTGSNTWVRDGELTPVNVRPTRCAYKLNKLREGATCQSGASRTTDGVAADSPTKLPGEMIGVRLPIRTIRTTGLDPRHRPQARRKENL
jgi:hypothetical protein